jgi:hypothetical protein
MTHAEYQSRDAVVVAAWSDSALMGMLEPYKRGDCTWEQVMNSFVVYAVRRHQRTVSTACKMMKCSPTRLIIEGVGRGNANDECRH